MQDSLSFRQPVAITVAPNGGRRVKSDHPDIPLTAEELARTAAECAGAGAAMIHVHVRDRQGRHLLDAKAYEAAISAIRKAVGECLIIQITTESLGQYQPREQMEVVKRTRPEAASLALREFVADEASAAEFSKFLAWMKSEAILPQIILYDPAEADQLADMQRRGLVPFEQIPVLYVLGRYVPGQTSTPADLLPFLAPERPCFSHWGVCAFGQHEAACVTAGSLLGGHVRVGFENNLYMPDGSMAASNAALVTAVTQALDCFGIDRLTADDLRSAWS